MKICCIFNIAPLYRKPIFSLMREELDADMFFGDRSSEGIALMKTASTEELRNRYKGKKLVWQKRAIRRAFSKRYDAYILTGNAGIRSNWVIAAVARLLGRKVYLWSHGLHGNEDPKTVKKNLAYFRLAGHALLYGERAQELLAQYGIGDTTVIYNSLDYENHLKIREHTGDGIFLRNYFGNDLPTICYLGRINPVKKLDMLLRAIVDVECNLVIVGGGESEEDLKQLSRELGIEDRVWFYGESYDEQFLGTLLTNCAVTINPSSIGLTAIHSLTFGTPIITHDDIMSQAPEAESVIEGVTGYYYSDGSVESLAETIEKALKLPKPTSECYDTIARKYNPAVQIEILKRLFGTDVENNRVSDK